MNKITDPHGLWCAMMNLVDTLAVIKETLSESEIRTWERILTNLRELNMETIESIATTYELSDVYSFEELLDGIMEHNIDEKYHNYSDEDIVDVIICNLEQSVASVENLIEDIKKLKEEGYKLPSTTYNEIINCEIEKRGE